MANRAADSGRQAIVWCSPDLGKTLRAIAENGPDVFYKGWIADRIADDMKAHGGLITKEDLAAYQARSANRR